MRFPLAAISALALTMVPGPAPARPKTPDLGLVVTRGKGRRPSKRNLKKFDKALRKALTKEEGWVPTSVKQAKTLFQVHSSRTSWRCRPDPVLPEDFTADGRVVHEDELFCAVDVVQDAGLDRLLLVNLRWANGAHHVDMQHIRVDLGKVVGRTSQRVSGKSIKPVLTFAPALARRGMKELGGFRLETNVEGADVDMDGMFLGRTPLEQPDMAPGSYKLKITADGYFDWEGAAEVVPGEMRVVRVELKQPRMSAPPPAFSGNSDMLKWGLVGLGAAAAIGGIALAATGDDPTTRTLGLILFAGGAGGAALAFTYEF